MKVVVKDRFLNAAFVADHPDDEVIFLLNGYVEGCTFDGLFESSNREPGQDYAFKLVWDGTRLNDDVGFLTKAAPRAVSEESLDTFRPLPNMPSPSPTMPSPTLPEQPHLPTPTTPRSNPFESRMLAELNDIRKEVSRDKEPHAGNFNRDRYISVFSAAIENPSLAFLGDLAYLGAYIPIDLLYIVSEAYTACLALETSGKGGA